MGYPWPLGASYSLPRDRRACGREGGFWPRLDPDVTTDSGVHQTAAALKAGIKVILCVGENLEERETNKTAEVVTRQLEACRKVLSEQDWA